MPINQVVHVISMRNCRVSAVWSMNMTFVVAGSPVSATIRMLLIHFNHMFINVVSMGVVKMTIVEIISVTVVLHRRMTAARTMFVGVIMMLITCHIFLLNQLRPDCEIVK